MHSCFHSLHTWCITSIRRVGRPEVDIPKHGMLGRNILATIATLWSEVRLPIGKIASMLIVYGLKISAGTINNALVNVADSAEIRLGLGAISTELRVLVLMRLGYR